MAGDGARRGPSDPGGRLRHPLRHPRLLVKLDHAARTEEKLLGKLGATVVAPAEHFFVVDTKGPLAEGEEDRARRWGRTLADAVAAAAAGG